MKMSVVSNENNESAQRAELHRKIWASPLNATN